MHCRPVIILDGEHFNVSQCAGCQRVGLHYHNLLVGFDPEQFEVFSDSFAKIDFKASAVKFPNGLERIIVNTCHQDIQFCFSETEFEEFRDLLQQALIILDARQIVEAKDPGPGCH